MLLIDLVIRSSHDLRRRGEADIPGRAMQAPDDPDESDQCDLHTQIASLTETVSTLQTEVEEKRLEVAVLTTMTDSLANAFIRLGSQVESLRNHFESSSEGFARDIQYLKRQLRPPSYAGLAPVASSRGGPTERGANGRRSRIGRLGQSRP
jgi:hypothetical protein